jgi:hypothetical protein
MSKDKAEKANMQALEHVKAGRYGEAITSYTTALQLYQKGGKRDTVASEW